MINILMADSDIYSIPTEDFNYISLILSLEDYNLKQEIDYHLDIARTYFECINLLKLKKYEYIILNISLNKEKELHEYNIGLDILNFIKNFENINLQPLKIAICSNIAEYETQLILENLVKNEPYRFYCFNIHCLMDDIVEWFNIKKTSSIIDYIF